MEDDVNDYKCQKGFLKQIIKNPNSISRIKNSVCEINKAVIDTYQFIKLFYLYSIKNNKIPIIDEQFIRLSFLVTCSKDNRGPPIKDKRDKHNKQEKQYSRVELKKELDNFYNSCYSKTLTNLTKPNLKKMSHTMNYIVAQMMLSFKNNMETHFQNHLKHFIMGTFDTIEKNEVYKIMNDLINNTLKSDQIYHSWIKKIKKKILPSTYEKSFYYDLVKDPLSFLPYSIYMNNYLETVGKKQFNCFPLRTNIIPKYITIDTASLIDLMMDSGSKQYTQGSGVLDKSKDKIWETYFKVNNKIF